MKSKQIGQNRKAESTFGQLLKQSFEEQDSLAPGSLFMVTVDNIKDQEYVFVKFEGGTGMISRAELTNSAGDLTAGPGEKLTAFFQGSLHGEKIFTLGPNGPVKEAVLRHAMDERIPLQGVIASSVKGGYEIRLGEVTAFCPGSQMDARESNDREPLLFLITEFSGKRVIASRRAYRDMERDIQKNALQESLSEGDILTAKVSSLRNFGAFVDLGGMDGLVPVSEISFERIQHPKEKLKVGDEVRVKVQKIDWKEGRLTLSIRALLENPWQGKLPFQQNEILQGQVDSIKNFGVFVKLPGNFTGLVPNSESGVERGQKLERFFKRGETIRVMVRFIDRENEKISLSVKGVKDAEVEQEYRDYMDKMNEPAGESISSFGKQLLQSLGEEEGKGN